MLFTAFVSLIWNLITVIVAIIAAAFAGLYNIVLWTVTFFSALATFFVAVASRKMLVRVIVAVTLVSVLLGVPASVDVNLVMKPIDFVAEGPSRQILEGVSKFGIINLKGLSDYLGPRYNTVITYLFQRLDLFWADAEDMYNAIAATADYLRLLESPRIVWRLVSSFVGYFWMSKPAGGKVEFFQELSHIAHFFQFTKTPPGEPHKYATDPSFGAFESVDDSDVLYYLWNFVFDFVNVLQGAGDIIVTKIAELAFPGQKFFPSFYVIVDTDTSFWRQLADWLTNVLSFLTGESFYPKEFTVAQTEAQATPKSVQPSRFDKQQHTARILRIIAQLPRVISLIVVHATTIRFPNPIGVVTGTGIEMIKAKLIGVPGVDLFLDPPLTNSTNPIILAKNYYACEQLLIVFNKSFSAATQCTASGGIFKGTLPTTNVNPVGSQWQCFVWSGEVVPQENERIDYFFEAYRLVISIAQYIEDPSGVKTLARDTAAEIFDNVLKPIIRLIYAGIHYLGTVFFPECNKDGSAFILAYRINVETVRILDYIYRPLTCNTGRVFAPIDPLTCFITMNSRSQLGNGFWGFLCKIIEAGGRATSSPPLVLQQYNCNVQRKRNFASETFAAKPAPEMPWSMYFQLRAMSAASETRKALDAFNECLFSQNSTANSVCAQDTCSLAPCIEETLDCIASRAPHDNMWSSALDTRNDTNVLLRNVITVTLNFIDLMRGCSDSYVMQAYNAIKQTGDYVRSYVASWMLVVGDFIPAYFQCMENLREAKRNGTVAEDDSLEFAYCIGLKERPPKPTRQQSFSERTNPSMSNRSVAESQGDWSSILNQHGIYANETWCGHRLHERGIVVDDIAITDSLSLDHVVFRICSFQLAFGTRAILAQSTTHKLADFIGGWSAPTALLGSMNRFGDQHLRLLDSVLPREIPKLGVRQQTNTEQTPVVERVSALGEALGELMPTIEMFSTLFHFYADLHDVVATSNTTPDEKAEMSQRLLLHHIGMHEESMQKRSAFQAGGAATQPILDVDRSQLARESLLRKRNFLNAIKKMDTRVGVLQEFGRSLYFAGKYPMAIAMDQQEDVEMEVKIERRYDLSTPLLSIRPVIKPEESWSLVPLNDIGDILDVLSASSEENAQRKQILIGAVSAYKNLVGALQARDQYTADAAHSQSGRAAIHYASIVVTSLCRIFNRRWMVEGYPVYHTASLFGEILAGRRKQLQYLPAWINNENHYLSGVGFVDNEIYDAYIKNIQAERDRATNLYAPLESTAGSRLADVVLFSVKRAGMWHAEASVNLEKKRKLLEGSSYITSYRKQQQTVVSKILKKRISFAHRSAFLVRHNIHGEDDCLHLIAPGWWEHRELAALANTTESRQRFNVIASLQAGQFLEALDEILSFFGAPPNTLESALIQFETSITNFFAVTNDPLYFDNLIASITGYLTSLACNVDQDVRITGTGTYTIFCIPYYWEKIFNWYEFFPKNRNKPLLGYFEDAGYIRWPPAIIDIDCPTQRDPTLQCAIEPPPPLFLQHPQNKTLNQYETLNGQNATTYPINTTSWFGNICFTDWCKIDPTSRPACPVFDYCERTYKQPSTFGFVNGAQNFIVWSNDIRVVYSNIIANDSLLNKRFWAIGILFLVLAFSDFIYIPLVCITIPSPVSAYLAAIVFIIVEFFILQTPETCAIVLIYLWIWLETIELVAWIQFVPLIIHLFSLKNYGVSFLTPVFNFIPNLFPDTLLVTVLKFLSNLTFLNFIYDVSTFDAYANSITAAQTSFPATELYNVLSLQTFYNAELLLVIVVLLGLVVVYLAGVAWAFLSAFVLALPVIGSIVSATANFFSSLYVARVADQMEDIEVEQVLANMRLQRRVEELERQMRKE
jgi:hypothetical protein